MIETSGVALPYDTQLNFWREPVCDWIGDDMAVVVVNADQLAEGRDLEGTFEDQVHSADLLVLNKGSSRNAAERQPRRQRGWVRSSERLCQARRDRRMQHTPRTAPIDVSEPRMLPGSGT